MAHVQHDEACRRIVCSSTVSWYVGTAAATQTITVVHMSRSSKVAQSTIHSCTTQLSYLGLIVESENVR